MSEAASLHPSPPPHPRTRLIGRDAERAVARVLLLEEAVPLLTLAGPGLSAGASSGCSHSFACA
jgi:hypothetical protein